MSMQSGHLATFPLGIGALQGIEDVGHGSCSASGARRGDVRRLQAGLVHAGGAVEQHEGQRAGQAVRRKALRNLEGRDARGQRRARGTGRQHLGQPSGQPLGGLAPRTGEAGRTGVTTKLVYKWCSF